jgi:TetR/AcrR family transcriptional regulator
MTSDSEYIVRKEKRMGPSLVGEINTNEKLPRRERENLRQRREILAAALKLFSEKGYHNVSMHEIAGEAEFGIGTLYKLFCNKEELYKALIMETAERWHAALLRVLETEGNPLRAIKRYIAARRELFSTNLPLMRLYFAETRGASFNIRAGLDQDILKLYDEGIERLAFVLEKGIRTGVFRHLDPYQMAVALDATLNAFLFQSIRGPAQFPDRGNPAIAEDIFLNGVLSK